MNAVIFDCDGVLVDSEPIAERVWADVLAGFGYEATEADFAQCRGRTRSDVYGYFAQRTALPDAVTLGRIVDDEIRPAFATQVEAFPDALDTVPALAMQGIPLAVASSSRRVFLDIKLERVGLMRYFDATIAGDEVPRGKPAPDLFLAAAQALDVEPVECLAIEDAPAGADAAEAAGMRVITVARDGGMVGGRPSVDRLDAAMILVWINR
jgi:HAD superfamily hydrolase (TIGR01509 family)